MTPGRNASGRSAPVAPGAAVVHDAVRVSASVSREVAGLGAVHRDVLARHLGLARWAYEELLRLRDPLTGLVRGITANLLAHRLPRVGRYDDATTEAMWHHLRTLTALGLVRVLAQDETGRKLRRAYWKDRTGRMRWKRVVDRVVLGAPGVGGSEMWSVPLDVQMAIEAKDAAEAAKPETRGGKRKGAGRPKGAKSGTGKGRFARHRPTRGSMSASALIAKTEELFPGSTGNQKFTATGIQTSAGLYSSLLSSLLLLPERSTRFASLTGSEGTAADAAVASAPSGQRDESKPAAVFAPVEQLREGLASHRPARTSPFARGLRHEALPAFVSLANTPDLRVATPSPPRLDDRETPERHAYLLMRWYEGACRARFGKEPGTFKRYRNGPKTSPHFDLLVKAAKAFIAHDIQPAAWCAFSCMVWERFGSGKGMPPLKFVFAEKRIAERAGWYRREADSYVGGRLLYTPKAKDFMRRQALLRDTLTLECPTTEEDLRAVVARFFPPGVREALLEDLREEAKALREELDRVVSLGEWVW